MKFKLFNKYYKFFLIILLFIILMLIIKYISLCQSKYYLKDLLIVTERFEKNNNCKGNAFCAYDLNKDKCVCASQKDDARLQFPNNPDCCESQCNTLPKEKCVKPNDLNIKYYCNVSGKCQEYNATIKDSVIMANICGIDKTTNQYIMPFSSKEDCERLSDVCNKYNDKELSNSQIEKNCLNNTNCGMCYNETGVGKCVSGSPAGPNDLNTYYFCKPNERKSNTHQVGGIYKYGKEFST